MNSLSCFPGRRLALGLGLSLLALTGGAQAGKLPELVVPDTCGMQVRTNYSDAALDAIQDIGVKVVRMGFHWEGIEQVKGKYDFTNMDAMMARARAHGWRVVGVLAFGNDKLYGHVYDSDDGRQGYAAYAAACAEHYKADHIMWELWNEPNTMTFWGKHGLKKGNSEPYADEYVNLVKVAVPAIRKADPDATILGGSISCLWSESYKWTEFCIQKGLLDTGIDAVSIHPYSVNPPEAYPKAYDVVREMMAKAGKPNFPILDTERGFPLDGKGEGFAGGDASRAQEFQSWNLVRQFLMDFTYGVRLTSWYEFDSKESFSLFVNQQLTPAGHAYKVMIAQLNGYHFVRRLPTQNDLDYVMEFANDKGGQKLVAWTSPPLPDPELNKQDKGRSAPDRAKPHTIEVPVSANGALAVVKIDGSPATANVANGNVSLDITGGPQYVTVAAGGGQAFDGRAAAPAPAPTPAPVATSAPAPVAASAPTPAPAPQVQAAPAPAETPKPATTPAPSVDVKIAPAQAVPDGQPMISPMVNESDTNAPAAAQQ